MRFLLRPGLLLLALLLLLPAMATADGEKDYRSAVDAYRKLADSSRNRLYRDHWNRLIDRFLTVQRTYPQHRRAPAALYQAGKACRDLYGISRRLEDASRAAELFQSLADRYPASTLADDALLYAAQLHEEPLADLPRAYRNYRRMVDDFPAGDMAPAARRKVAELARYAPSAPIAAGKPASPGSASPPAAATADRALAELSGIRLWSTPGYTRVVLDLSGPADFTANLLAGDPAAGQVPRLYVDVRGVAPGRELAEVTQVQDGLLKQVRTGRFDGETVRVVLDLVSLKDYKIFPLSDPSRIVLDVTGDQPLLSADRPQLTAPPQENQDVLAEVLGKGPQERPLTVRVPPATGSVLRRVVVDAGHGGKDPGAIGPKGLMEKDVTLAMAKVLARKLKEEIGCEVILTRSGDVYLPLEERTAIANRVGADLFISIHANAAPNRNAFGIETYYLNFSKNDKAAAVAARENGTSLKQVGDLELILFDLMANSKINESSRLAAEIQKSLVSQLGRDYQHVKDLGVRQGPFYVLLGATMPSVLVETAFISHPREESRLKDRRFHEKAAAAIVHAVQQYANALRMIAAQ